MIKNKQTHTQLNCFSPPIMLATLIIEVVLAIYTIWRYKINILGRLVVMALLALATFQLAEYFVCTGADANREIWSRVGFIAITLLPPIGLHLMHVIAGRPKRQLVQAAYATMAGFVAFFMIYPSAFIGEQCTGNYVIFQIGERLGGLYATYYYGWLFTALFMGIKWASQTSKSAIRRLQAIRGLLVGYLVFLVPTASVNTLFPDSRRGIPSIMCGFAVLFALILTLYILPRVGSRRAD